MALVSLAEAAGAQVIHATKHAGPVRCRLPVVLSVHDAMYFTHPRLWGWAEGVYWRAAMRASVPRARVVLVPSEHARGELLRLGLARPERVRVCPYGSSERFEPGSAEAVQEVRQRIAGGRPYLLAVGTLGRKKNLAVLVRAAARASRALGERLTLVIAGRTMQQDSRLQGAMREAEDAADIHLTGWVSDADLLLLYQGAAVFLFASLGEGFGLPVVEAMRSGVPVVSSLAGSLREIVEPAGLGVEDPMDDAAFAAGIERLLTDGQLAADLRTRGLDWARGFTWERCARGTLEAYRLAAGA
jgi:alpha-1,3-rhamnosyl/mannosyltransferase